MAQTDRPDMAPDRLIGMSAAELGDEAGLLETVVGLAQRQAAAGRAPFAAVVVRSGTIIGVGVNTVEEDLDPSAHAEVTAVRDAARRLRETQLAGTVLYTSCEPCALCRTVAHAAGVGELVFAAPKESVAAVLGAGPDEVFQLIEGVAAVLPDQTRRGTVSMSDDQLAHPFTVFAERGGDR